MTRYEKETYITAWAIVIVITWLAIVFLRSPEFPRVMQWVLNGGH